MFMTLRTRGCTSGLVKCLQRSRFSTTTKTTETTDGNHRSVTPMYMGNAKVGRVSNPLTTLFSFSSDQMNEMCRQYSEANTAINMTQRAIDMLEQCHGKEFELGLGLDLYHHNLQCATLAYKDNCEDDIIAIALLHDIGELLSPLNHGDIAAAILKPYISEKAHWILQNHEVFQAYTYLHEPSKNIGKRICENAYKNHKYFDDALSFCQKYDAPAFDPSKEIMDINQFKPLLIDIFSRKPYHDDPNNPKAQIIAGYYNDK